MRFAELEHADVAVWGYGREGCAALAALRARAPGKPLTLYCLPAEAADARAAFVGGVTVIDVPPDADALARHGVVVKSPGISAYRPEIAAAAARGTRFTSGTALWFGERPDARVIAVTGTKGKSTTTALIAHLARSLGVRTALAGNIGMPLLELLEAQAALWVVELSSFQTREAGPLELGVVTSLYEEHLDWHGSRERYVADKLALADAARTLLVNAAQPRLLELTAAHPRRRTFGDADGWHVAGGAIRRAAEAVLPLAELPLPGAHNAANACAALAALELLDLDARAAAPALRSFRALPHRLQRLGERDGIAWINDSISTTPQAALAALQSLEGRAVTLIVGGHDRGLDWSEFVARMRERPPLALICQGASGARIADELERAGVAVAARCADLADAVAQAHALTPPGGCVLLSPGAPSFDQFRDYAARGRRFAELAGFDGAAITGIEGLGVA
ncbi:UDP-N-acetylmuramoylalanine--D-glutamate ligase [Mizugakiibacter sediminis]|uniref:UDP-N-acetylmuramoyl-L-alanine--L-glutamate ligase n=2 Tax=Mizugakiibacter sediminis TaxID=1475481 RepID=A0A0K8QPP5_9GAMM|nr:UDP-N-acetylmuramoyl-L-alanine--D-glutamate ligase [Mizugakiibacter sediminis]GAP66641.1 UDP-N-acetylmuramoylalanine--D-glutamate ligase [Mizugakiibacter sediminis]